MKLIKRNKLLSWGLAMAIELSTLPLNAMTSYAASFTVRTESSTGATGAGSVKISWDKAGDNIYKVYKSTDGTNYETVGVNYEDVKKINVLHIYPNIASSENQLKDWMIKNGYGKGLMNIDTVSFTYFNNSPYRYLTTNNSASNPAWKYDVIFFGTWDTNYGCNISNSTASAVEKYIKSGRGCIMGHDTIGYTYDGSGFANLKSYFGLEIGHYGSSTPGKSWGYWANRVKITKKSLFTTYPNYIGEPGTVLNIPTSHTCANAALNNNVMLELTSGSYSAGEAPASIKNAGYNDRYFLTVKNNCAMIQTGHSNGASTDDEQKILANLIFYTVQLHSNSPVKDNSAMDYAAPKTPTIKLTNNDNTAVFSSTDNGTKYYYKVEEFSKNNTYSPLRSSNVTQVLSTTGIKEYRYIIDTNSGTVVSKTNSSSTTGSNISVSHTNEVRYLHVAAVDKAGNISSTSTIKLKKKDQTAPLIKSVSDTYQVQTEDDEKNKENEYVSGVKGFAVTAGQTAPAKTAFTTDKNLKNRASSSGYNYAWAIDNEGNISKPYKVFIHSDLYYNGKEVNKVVYNSSPLLRFIYNLKKIFV